MRKRKNMEQRPLQHFFPTLQDLLASPTQSEGKQWVVGAVIVNARNQVFVQKRSLDRRLFPGCWDLVGGHVEPEETLETALRREIQEETGWQLLRILALVDFSDWDAGANDKRQEADFLVEVAGDLEHPQLEWSKHTEFRWVGFDELELLKENRSSSDSFIYDVVKNSLERGLTHLEERKTSSEAV
jgi:8-oxo-dGTP pyrophosphatase MutT (NUDIX family)